VARRKRRNQRDLEIYRMQAEIAKVLANAVRLRILALIGHREVANSALLEDLDISKANLSQHAALLRKVGMISVRREGLRVFYRLTCPEIKEFCSSMRGIVAKQLMESARKGNRLMRRVN
jgi:DNA-binding transcriptional ArsR family regulator